MKAMRPSTIGMLGLLIAGGCAPGEESLEAAPASAPALLALGTSVAAARAAFLEGEAQRDVASPIEEQYPHFKAAAEADPGFALAHLRASQSAPSAALTHEHLAAAVQAGSDSEPERLLVEIARKQVLEGDTDAALALAMQLTAAASGNPRSWVALAQLQQSAGRVPEYRSSLEHAIELAPDFVLPRLLLGESLTGQRGGDLARAEEQIQRAIALAPAESFPYDLLGDVRRRQNRLPEAAEAYGRAAELAPTRPLPLQQRGHVRLYLGEYDDARADYDAASRLATGNPKADFLVYRALVSIVAGDPAATVDELGQLVDAIDGMGIPDPTGGKIEALIVQTYVAAHHGLMDRADAALSQLSDLWREQADQVQGDAFRRGRAADIAYMEGLVAAYRGQEQVALGKAEEIRTQLAPLNDPHKNEGAAILQGLVALRRSRWDEAIAHFDDAIATYVSAGGVLGIGQYLAFHRALALEGAGRSDEAMATFRDLAGQNFAGVGVALTRGPARTKTGS